MLLANRISSSGTSGNNVDKLYENTAVRLSSVDFNEPEFLSPSACQENSIYASSSLFSLHQAN